jgi:uncharacterized membrane protein YkoI
LLKSAFMCRSACRLDNPDVLAQAFSRVLRHALLAATLVALTVPQAARAEAPHDHERARAAVQAGEILPLQTLLERLQRTHPGQVLELELERDDGRWIYELRLLQAGGQLLKLEVDAATGEVLKARRKRPAKDAAP